MKAGGRRFLDTRDGYTTADGIDQGIGAFASHGLYNLQIAGRSSISSTGVNAVIFNLTAVQPESTGFITAWPSGETQPPTSNLNLSPQLTIPNLVISGLGSGQVSLFNGSINSTNLVADVQGWFPNSSGYGALAPARLLDTRSGAKTIDGLDAGIGALATASTVDLLVTGRGGVPQSGVGTVVLNITSVLPTQSGYMTVWPTGSARPMASNLNLNPGITVANLVLAKVGTDGKVSIFNGSQASTDVLVDVQGWMK